MKLKKRSDEPKLTITPVSFRLDPEILRKLNLIALVLDKTKSLVIEQIILEAHKSVLRDYPDDIEHAEAKLIKMEKKISRARQ